MILQNIPHELRALPQWVVAGTDKVPLNPRTGQPASPTDPTTWATFEEAVATGYAHVGFVLAKSDPYCIVDLDDPETVKINGIVQPNPDREEVARIQERHKRMLAAFECYAELSQSGKGVHIICRASVPKGARRQKVEVYSDSRYMICTGRVIKQLPITDQQPLVSMLFAEMEAQRETMGQVELVQVAGTLTDEEVYNMGCNAANGDKFRKLWAGEWEGNPLYESQSDADFALLAMLAFYTPDNEQVRRLFRWSGLAREKTNKTDYHLNLALSKLRAKAPPPVDLSALIARGSALVPMDTPAPVTPRKPPLPAHAKAQTFTPPTGSPADNDSTLRATEQFRPPTDSEIGQTDSETDGENYRAAVNPPPGFVGELAGYIYSSAIRPVPEIALAASIALTAGVVARSFNISGTGLNQYLLVLAKTGSGKEGAANGIDAMVSAVRPQVPMIDEFIGPGAFASGQALVRVLDKNPCFVSVLGEFGLTLQAMCSPNANGAQVMLKKVLLDIFAKSGFTKTLRSSVYSDSDKNTKAIHAPNVSIFGESNPEKFYEGLDAGIISEGLLPRFSIFEYTGPRPDANPNAFAPPPDSLVRYFGGLAAVAMAAQQNRVCSPVQMDRDALPLLGLGKAFDRHATAKINSNPGDVNRQLWNRAHLKAMKLAALIAVGNNPHQPIINKQVAEWSINCIEKEITSLLAKFDAGEVGTGDVRLELDVKRAIAAYLKMSPTDRMGYDCPQKMATLQLVPFQYLRRRLRLLVNFKTDRRGANNALTQTLNALVEGEVLVRISPIQAREACGTNAPVFGLGPAW